MQQHYNKLCFPHSNSLKSGPNVMPLDGSCDNVNDWNVLCLDCVGVIGVQEFKGITFGPDMREFE